MRHFLTNSPPPEHNEQSRMADLMDDSEDVIVPPSQPPAENSFTTRHLAVRTRGDADADEARLAWVQASRNVYHSRPSTRSSRAANAHARAVAANTLQQTNNRDQVPTITTQIRLRGTSSMQVSSNLYQITQGRVASDQLAQNLIVSRSLLANNLMANGSTPDIDSFRTRESVTHRQNSDREMLRQSRRDRTAVTRSVAPTNHGSLSRIGRSHGIGSWVNGDSRPIQDAPTPGMIPNVVPMRQQEGVLQRGYASGFPSFSRVHQE